MGSLQLGILSLRVSFFECDDPAWEERTWRNTISFPIAPDNGPFPKTISASPTPPLSLKKPTMSTYEDVGYRDFGAEEVEVAGSDIQNHRHKESFILGK